MAIRTDQYTNTLSVVDTVTANASLSLVPQGTGTVDIPGTGQNLLTYSEQFDNAAWSKNASTISVDATIAPNGTTTADKLQETAVTAFFSVGQNPSGVYSARYAHSFYAKSAERTQVAVSFTVSSAFAIFDLSNGTVSSSSGSNLVSASIVSVGNGWYRCQTILTTVASGANPLFFIISLINGGLSTYAGVAGNGAFIWGAQLELASSVGPYVQTTSSAIYGNPTLSLTGTSALGLQSDGSLYASSAGAGNIRLYTNNVAQEQVRVAHTASAVNYLQLTGGATTVAPTISAQGSDANVTLRLIGKGSGTVDLGGNGNPYAFQVVPIASGSNYNGWKATSAIGGSAAGSTPVLSTWGIDTNIALALQSKGTGGIDLAAGSAGVNISNGGTVTALTLVNTGGSYTTLPTVTISAPTTAGGVQATANPRLFATAATVQTGGTGYTLNDVVTIVGGTPVSTSATFTVTGVSGGAITSLTPLNYGTYTAVPTNPVSITGGTGSSATLNVSYGVVSFVITNAGSGYVEQPTVTITGGGGAAATAYATVGSGTVLRTLGSQIDFTTPGGVGFRVVDNGLVSNFPRAYGRAAGSGLANLDVVGSDTDITFQLNSKGTGAVALYTNSGNQQQLRVAHTASAVNYVQVTGAATGGAPSLVTQGSDTNISLAISPKGTGILYLGSGGQTRITGSGANTLFLAGGSSGVNYIQLSNAPSGFNPSYIARGSDANVGLSFGTYNDANIDFYASGDPNAGTGKLQLRVAPTASAVNYVQVTGAATGQLSLIQSTGSDTNSGLEIRLKGAPTGPGFRVSNNSGANVCFGVQVSVASPVNYIYAIPTATGFGPVITANGSDTNIPLVLQPKGTGALQAQQTDSTATGGNARGANAVDWQTLRSTNTMVANGLASVLTGGQNNTASSYTAFVGAGANNSATGPNSAIVAGNASYAPGQWSFIGSGNGNTAGGFYNFIGGGQANGGTAQAAVTTQSATMNGTTAVTLAASNAAIKVGQYITGTPIAANTYVAAVSGTSLTLSQAASGSGTATLSFYTPHGVVVGGGNNTATGSYSFIGGGGDAGTAANRNVASGDWSTVGGGVKNTATGIGAVIAGGGYDGTIYGNNASGNGSVISGGIGHTASSNYTTVLGGAFNLANGSFSTVSGASGTTRSITGNTVVSAQFGAVAYANGVAQSATLILGRQTTDATATRITSDGNVASTTNQVILPNNAAYFFTGEIVAGVTGGGDTKGWKIEGVIKRGANAASTALVGTPTVTSMYADVGAATWTIAVTADTTNGGLAVTFTGQTGTTIRVVAQIRTTEMTF